MDNNIFDEWVRIQDNTDIVRKLSDQRENQIQKLKVDEGLSYPAARRLLESNSGKQSYAGVVETGNNNEMNELRKKVEELIDLVKAKDRRIEQLENALLNRENQNVLSNQSQEAAIPTNIQVDDGNQRTANELV